MRQRARLTPTNSAAVSRPPCPGLRICAAFHSATSSTPVPARWPRDGLTPGITWRLPGHILAPALALHRTCLSALSAATCPRNRLRRPMAATFGLTRPKVMCCAGLSGRLPCCNEAQARRLEIAPSTQQSSASACSRTAGMRRNGRTLPGQLALALNFTLRGGCAVQPGGRPSWHAQGACWRPRLRT